jgi:hypothetical protein
MRYVRQMFNTYGIGADCRWPDVLSNLLAAADWGSPFAPQFKLRALRSLKHIFKGLMTKRFVAEPLPQQPGSSAALGKRASDFSADFFSLFLAVFLPFLWHFLLISLQVWLCSLQHIFKGLMTKRIVAEPLPQQPAPRQHSVS